MTKAITLSGTTSPNIYLNNNSFNNGLGTVSTYLMPLGVAVTSDGNVFAFDDYVNVVRKIDPTGYTSQYAGDSNFISPSFKAGYLDGVTSMALFTNITAIATDKNDNIFLMDNNRIRKIDLAGNVTTVAGDGTSLVFKSSAGLCLDSAGNIYVSDTENNRIRKVTPAGVITTIATGFKNPKGITIDNSGALYVCDSGNSVVKKITSAGVVSVYATGFGTPSGVCIDANGNLFVTDSLNSIIYKVNTSGVVTNYIGSGYQQCRDGNAGLLKTSASFYNPEGICIDASGNLYVADKNSQKIRKVTP